VIDSHSGDVLLLNGKRFRMIAVQRFRTSAIRGTIPFPEGLEWIAEWDPQNVEQIRRWRSETAPAAGWYDHLAVL